MNLRKQDFRAEVLTKQWEGNKKNKDKKTNCGSKHHHQKTKNTYQLETCSRKANLLKHKSYHECKGKGDGNKKTHKENSAVWHKAVTIMRKANDDYNENIQLPSIVESREDWNGGHYAVMMVDLTVVYSDVCVHVCWLFYLYVLLVLLIFCFCFLR